MARLPIDLEPLRRINSALGFSRGAAGDRRMSAPGTIGADPDAIPSRIRFIGFDSEDMVDVETTLEELPGLMKRWELHWINVYGLGSHDVLQGIATLFGIHALALEDISNVPQRSKVDDYGSSVLIVLKMASPRTLESGVEGHVIEQFSMWLAKDAVVTFQETSEDCLDPLRHRIQHGLGRVRRHGHDYLAYAIIDNVVDGFFPVVEAQADLLGDLERRIADEQTEDLVHAIQAIKSDLQHVRRAIWPIRDTVLTLTREEGVLRDDTRLYLRDCHDHAVELVELTEGFRETTSDLMALHLSIVSHRMNEVMKVLTVIATIFIPLSFIAGVYGMNFNTAISPFNMPELNWVYGYPFALALMASFAAVLLVLFRRKGWF